MSTRSISTLLLLSTISFSGMIAANDNVCFQLGRGEATQTQRPAFKKQRGCNNEEQNCDVHKRLGIPLNYFDEDLTQRLNVIFTECIQNSSRNSASVNLKKYQKAYLGNPDKVTALTESVLEGRQILDKLVAELEQAESLKGKLLDRIKGDKSLSIFREHYGAQIDNILLSQAQINQLYANLVNYHQKHKLRTNEFPTNHSDIRHRVDEINTTLDAILQFQINRVLSEVYPLVDSRGNPEFKPSWNSKKLKDYRQLVLSAIEAQKLLTSGINKYLAHSSQETKQRHNELVSYSAKLSESLSSIDEAIIQSIHLEKVKAANQAWLDAVPTQNIVLVAQKLGYNNGFVLLGGKNVFPFHTYLGCLAQYYRGYLFQGYEIDGDNGSRQLLLKFYSGARATGANLSASIAISKISQDRYVFADIQEYETGYDLAGQVRELSVRLISACRQEYNL